ncbi:hypothetical protein JCM3775_007090 [Rhodotorula graminis]|uniref:DUF962 domain-containing protein n=1 Tax=Rhodotorula graminis (strain WP1) TaxID=578459 RepID=A0A194SDG3_RHOGW|nr:uncharacterized protein RHOBADRAFT_41208 [Rhodotorula graminis WP1]KPV78664.1 hypothetical protein RHOBADRAFT_41208 [Rhodotorula graminis WP1]
MSTLGKTGRVANPTYEPQAYAQGGYATFRSFYPYYLGEHSNAICRRLHLVGTTISLGVFTRALVAAIPLLATTKDRRLDVLRFGDDGFKSIGKLLLGGLLQGYVWAWVGHFFFEKNRPATFKHPFYSFLGDLTLWREVVTFRRRA